MHYITYTLAWRYITRSAQEGTISAMVFMSFLGIFVGSCALTIISAIMHGFDVQTQKKLQGIHAQAIMHSYGQPLQTDAISKILNQEFSTVTAFCPTSQAHGLLQGERDAEGNAPSVIIIKAVDPSCEAAVTTLTHTSTPANCLTQVDENKIMVGKKLAEHHGLHIGDTVQIYYAEKTAPTRNKVTFHAQQAQIIGFLQTGIDEFDNSLLLCSFDFFDRLFPDLGIQEIHLTFASGSSVQTTIDALKKRFQLPVYSWQELYPALMSALLLEKYVSFIVLALIILVASMNIIALIFMKITAKRLDIAILKAIGMADREVRNIFVLFGTGIATSAALCGIAVGSLISWLVDHYQLITLPDAYYVTHVPACLTWQIPVGVFFLVCCMGFCASLIPARRVRTMSIAHTLRFQE